MVRNAEKEGEGDSEEGRDREGDGRGRAIGNPMGPDTHSTDSDRYDSKESGLWCIYKLRQQGRHYLSACNTTPITLNVRESDYPLRPP